MDVGGEISWHLLVSEFYCSAIANESNSVREEC